MTTIGSGAGVKDHFGPTTKKKCFAASLRGVSFYLLLFTDFKYKCYEKLGDNTEYGLTLYLIS